MGNERLDSGGSGAVVNQWLDLAACRQYPADMFYAEHRVQQEYAQQICKTCDVVWECLMWEQRLPANSRYLGVWGGLRPKQRRRLFGRPPNGGLS